MSTHRREAISVVATVLNEKRTIVRLLKGLADQSFLPNEIIIVDGGSTDGTVDTINSFKKSHNKEFSQIVKVFKCEGNRSKGRNFGIENAKNELIAITDAGCIPRKSWLINLIRCFRESKANVIAGYYIARAKSKFGKCLAPYVLVMPDKVDKSKFLPSSRSMLMTKDVWKRNGKFPIQYSHNEDYVFAKRLQGNEITVSFCKDAVVGWIPRKNIFEAAKMFFRFALGDVEAGIIRPKVVLVFTRYFLAIVLVYYQGLKVGFTLLFVYLIWSILKNFHYVRIREGTLLLPAIQITSDFMVITGSITGCILSLSRRIVKL